MMFSPLERYVFCSTCGLMHPEICPGHNGATLVDVCPVCNDETPHSYYPLPATKPGKPFVDEPRPSPIQ